MKTIAPLALILGLLAAPAHAFVAPTFCTGSKEIGQSILALPSFPEKPIRLEVQITGGIEKVTSAPADLIVRLSQNQPQQFGRSGRPFSYVATLMARRPGVETVEEKDYRPLAPPTPPDGRYVILALERRSRSTPSSVEQTRDCRNGSVRDIPAYSDISTPLVYQKCNRSCSSIDTATLINQVYEPERTASFLIMGRKSFRMGASRDDPKLRPFAVLGSYLDPDRIAQSRTGSQGRSFHPEIFAVSGVVRNMRPSILDAWERMPLITSVSSLKPCPLGDTEAACAPEEAGSRAARVRGYPEGGRFSTGVALPPASREERAAVCETQEECLAQYHRKYGTGHSEEDQVPTRTKMPQAPPEERLASCTAQDRCHAKSDGEYGRRAPMTIAVVILLASMAIAAGLLLWRRSRARP